MAGDSERCRTAGANLSPAFLSEAANRLDRALRYPGVTTSKALPVATLTSL